MSSEPGLASGAMLLCTTCESALVRLDNGPAQQESWLVRCRCGTWPVVAGVHLWNQHGHRCAYGGPVELDIAAMVDAIERGDSRAVRRFVIGDEIADHLDRVEDSGETLTLRSFLRYRGDVPDAQYDPLTPYYRSRLANPSILAKIPLLDLLGEHHRVLDVAAGMGFVGWEISNRLASTTQLAGLDLNMVSLYAAGRFLVPGATLIHANLEARLPLSHDVRFDRIFWSDAICFLTHDRKASLWAELASRLDQDGLLFVTDALTPAFPPRDWGALYTMTADEYRGLFPGMHVRMFPASVLVDARMTGRPVDLDTPPPYDEIVRAPKLTLIVSRSDRPLGSVGKHRFGGTRPAKLIVSPFYRVEREVDGVVARRRLPLPELGDNPGFRWDTHLLERVALPVEAADGELPDDRAYDPLLASGVFIRVPPTY